MAVYVNYNYADDIKLYSTIKTADNYDNLQSSLDKLYNWSCAWQLSISYKKIFIYGCQ